jgi:hypothetical protein
MAEAPAAAPETSAPSPSGPDAGLDSAIAALEASIPELQGRGSNQQTPTDSAPPAADRPAPTDQPAGEQPAQEAGTESDDDDEGLDNQPVAAGQKLSRTARIRQQLAQAEDRARQLEGHVQQREQEYRAALSQFVDLVLPDAQLEQLRIQAEGGDWEAKQRVDQARAWRRMVAPIADLSHKAARQEFDAALQELRTLDGMDSDSHQKLLQAQTPGEKLRLMHQLARKAAETEFKERIAALEADNQALKTNKASNGSQPATGGAPRNGASGLAGLVGRDGLLTDDALNLTPQQIRERFGAVH